MTPDSLEVTLTTSQTVYAAGGPVDLALKITNRGSDPVTLQFSTSQRYDFLVLDAADDTVWRWSADKMFMQVLGQEQLGPGESRDFREHVAVALPPGEYAAVGRVTARRVLEARRTFEVR